MSTFAFAPQILLDTAVPGNQRHQRLRLMGVELVSHKNPGSFWIGLDRLFNVGSKIFFCAPWSNCGSNNLTCSNLKIRNQALCAMADIFKLFALNVTRQHWQRGMEPFESLHPSYLVTTHYMCSLLMKRGSCLVDLAHGADLLS